MTLFQFPHTQKRKKKEKKGHKFQHKFDQFRFHTNQQKKKKLLVLRRYDYESVILLELGLYNHGRAGHKNTIHTVIVCFIA